MGEKGPTAKRQVRTPAEPICKRSKRNFKTIRKRLGAYRFSSRLLCGPKNDKAGSDVDETPEPADFGERPVIDPYLIPCPRDRSLAKTLQR